MALHADRLVVAYTLKHQSPDDRNYEARIRSLALRASQPVARGSEAQGHLTPEILLGGYPTDEAV